MKEHEHKILGEKDKYLVEVKKLQTIINEGNKQL